MANVTIVVGNTAPTVSITFPPTTAASSTGATRSPTTSTVTDPRTATVDCADVTLCTSLGHDAHSHPHRAANRLLGHRCRRHADGGHGAEANIFWTLEATFYTDNGGAVARSR